MVEQDHIFHSLICKSSKNKRLYKLWSSLNSTSYAIFLTVISENVGSLSGMSTKHRAVMEKLRSGKCETACQSVKDHYLGTGRNLFLKYGEPAPD